MKRTDWIPQSMKETMEEDHILINIGGLMFETPKSILKRDPGSLLAQLCGPEPPLIPDPDGFFFFDRDWLVNLFHLMIPPVLILTILGGYSGIF